MTTTQTDALKMCPFCGSKAYVVRRDVEPQGDVWYGGKIVTFVECGACGAALFDGYFHDGFVDDKSAIAACNSSVAVNTVAPQNSLEWRSQIAKIAKTAGVQPDASTGALICTPAVLENFARTLLSASPQGATVTEWLPIETAPKDGSRVLIYSPSGRRPVQEAWWAIPYEGATKGTWQTPCGPNGRGYMILPEAVVHWMPLPAAPQPDGDA